MQPQRFLFSITTVAAISLGISMPVWGQTFSSGSTGADGALDLTGGSQTIQVPPSASSTTPRSISPKGKLFRSPTT